MAVISPSGAAYFLRERRIEMRPAEGYLGPPEGGYSGFDNPGMGCPCRNCIFSGIYGGDASKPGYLCPYNKRIAGKAFESVDRLIRSMSAIIENVCVAAGIEFKGGDGLSDIREKNRAGSECPKERMDEKAAVGGGCPHVGGEVKEHGG
jgi:hypothetical protein